MPEFPIIARPELSAKALNGEASYENSTTNLNKSQAENTQNLSENLAENITENTAKQSEISSEISTQEPIKVNENGCLYKDSIGKNHFIRKEIGDAWIRTFNLKNLSDDFVPKNK